MFNLTPLPSLTLLCLSGPNLMLVGVMFAIVESLKLYAMISSSNVDWPNLTMVVSSESHQEVYTESWCCLLVSHQASSDFF